MPKRQLKVIRAILIDPTTRSLEEVLIAGRDQVYSTALKMLECSGLDHVYTPRREFVWLLDDEGLLKKNPGPFWQPVGYPQPLAGKALMLGLTEHQENYCSNELDLEFLRPKIHWPSVRFTGFKESSGNETDPVFGQVFVVRREAQFEPIPEGSSRSIH